jgi:lysozyme
MTDSTRLAIAMAALAAFAFWPRRAQASIAPGLPSSGPGLTLDLPTPALPDWGTFDPLAPSLGYDWQTWTEPPSWGYDWQPWADPYSVGTAGEFYESFDTDEIAMKRLRAFLYMIQLAEHLRSDVVSGEHYRTVYGGKRFRSFADHPVITGEWTGQRLTDQQCRDAGFSPGCKSTAAGAYQIIRPTWERVRQAGSWGPRLTDFSPASQDEAARRLLIESGALAYVERGEFERAVAIASRLWASLPGSTANQRPKSLATVTGFYNEGLRLG